MKDRIKEALDYSGMTMDEFEAMTSISKHKWGNLFTGKQRVNEDHLEAVKKIWPEYTYWIVTGEVLPGAGQISPELDKIREDSKRAGKAG